MALPIEHFGAIMAAAFWGNALFFWWGWGWWKVSQLEKADPENVWDRVTPSVYLALIIPPVTVTAIIVFWTAT